MKNLFLGACSFLAVSLIASPAITQYPTPAPTPPDISVMGLQKFNPQNTVAANPAITPALKIQSQISFSQAQIFARCAKPPLDVLRVVLDGPPNEASTIFAQGRFVEQHIACHIRYELDHTMLPEPTVLGRSLQAVYDRGAILEYALKTYLPDLKLTRAETQRKDVIDRFFAVEQARNRYRWPEDLDYFKVAFCIVHAEPELAGHLLHVDPAAKSAEKTGALLIIRARGCVPKAKRIEVDPTQFRIYVLDAYYRWAEAAHGVDSLLPAA